MFKYTDNHGIGKAYKACIGKEVSFAKSLVQTLLRTISNPMVVRSLIDECV